MDCVFSSETLRCWAFLISRTIGWTFPEVSPQYKSREAPETVSLVQLAVGACCSSQCLCCIPCHRQNLLRHHALLQLTPRCQASCPVRCGTWPQAWSSQTSVLPLPLLGTTSKKMSCSFGIWFSIRQNLELYLNIINMFGIFLSKPL